MSEAIIQPTERPILPPTESPPATMTGAEMFGKELDAAFNAIDSETPKKDEVKEPEADVKESVSEEQPEEKSTPKIDLKPEEPEVVEQIPEDAAVPRKSEDWKKFKSAYNATRTLLKDREANLAELEKQAERVKELDNVLKEREDLQAKLKEYSVLGDPMLTKDIDTRIESVTSKAKAGLDGMKAALLETVSRMPAGEAKDNLLAELFEDVPAHKQAVIGAHVATLEELYGEREAKLTEARTHADESLKRRDADAKAGQERRRATLDAAYKEAVSDLRTKEGWSDLFENQEVANLIDSGAKEIYSGSMAWNRREKILDSLATEGFYPKSRRVVRMNLKGLYKSYDQKKQAGLDRPVCY